LAAKKKSLITTAERYVEKGQYKRAISAYLKLAKLEPENIRTQLKLGELYIKSGSLHQAKDTLLNTTRHYEESGMILKAIAVYNQILQLVPGDPDIRLLLANAYKRIGLANDAAFQYGIAIKGYERNKDVHRKLETIRTLLELDPENLTTRLRLAEEFSRHGMIDEAAEQFQATCDSLLEKGLVDEFAQVAERLLFHKPDAFDVSKLLARYYLTKDYPQRALPLLHVCYKKHNQDVEVMNLLSHAFQRLGQVHKSVVVLGQLASFYAKSGLSNEEDEVKDRIIALDPEHPLAKEAKVNKVISGTEALPSIEMESGAKSTAAAPEVSNTDTLQQPKEQAMEPTLPENPPEVVAVPTQEFTVEIPIEPPALSQAPPPAPTPPAAPPQIPKEPAASKHEELAEQAGPTVVFEIEESDASKPPSKEQKDSGTEDNPGDDGMTIEFDMSAAAKTVTPLPISKGLDTTEPPMQFLEPIRSTISTSPPVNQEDELITSEFELPPSHPLRSETIDEEVNDRTLVDSEIPFLASEPEFEMEIPVKPWTDAQRGELLEFDFFLEAGLLDEAHSVLAELEKVNPEHPDVTSRSQLLASMRKESS